MFDQCISDQQVIKEAEQDAGRNSESEYTGQAMETLVVDFSHIREKLEIQHHTSADQAGDRKEATPSSAQGQNNKRM